MEEVVWGRWAITGTNASFTARSWPCCCHCLLLSWFNSEIDGEPKSKRGGCRAQEGRLISVDFRDSQKVSTCSSCRKIACTVTECWSWKELILVQTKRLRSDGKDLRDYQVPFSHFPEESPTWKPKTQVNFSTSHGYQRWEWGPKPTHVLFPPLPSQGSGSPLWLYVRISWSKCKMPRAHPQRSTAGRYLPGNIRWIPDVTLVLPDESLWRWEPGGCIWNKYPAQVWASPWHRKYKEV